jgi:glycerate kinase
MRILVAPQEFKGSLTAREAAEAIAEGLRRAMPEAELELLPVADGGPGTLDALVDATGGTCLESTVQDSLGRPVRARWGALGGSEHVAVIEMAAASGLTLLTPSERDPYHASTYGTGELLRAALQADHRRIIVGVGGSATNDGGAGAAQALGARLLDENERELPPGGAALARLDRIDVSRMEPALADAEITVATDVTNPLCGPEGASLIYGAQKGASEAGARDLDAALAHFSDVIRRDLGIDISNVVGGGAAGGLAAGLVAFCGARIRPGFDVVAEAVGLADRVAQTDAVVTGEGRLDRQTAFGKTTAGVSRLARAAGKPVIAIAGSVEGGAGDAFDAVFTLTPLVASQEEAIRRARELLEQVAERTARWLAGRLAG